MDLMILEPADVGRRRSYAEHDDLRTNADASPAAARSATCHTLEELVCAFDNKIGKTFELISRELIYRYHAIAGIDQKTGPNKGVVPEAIAED